MKVNDILDLIRAGYTKADIEAMEAVKETPAEVPAKPAADPKPAQPAEAQPAEAQPAEAKADPVMEELKALRDQVTKMNLAQGAAAIPDEEDLMKKALAKLIGG